MIWNRNRSQANLKIYSPLKFRRKMENRSSKILNYLNQSSAVDRRWHWSLCLKKLWFVDWIFGSPIGDRKYELTWFDSWKALFVIYRFFKLIGKNKKNCCCCSCSNVSPSPVGSIFSLENSHCEYYSGFHGLWACYQRTTVFLKQTKIFSYSFQQFSLN